MICWWIIVLTYWCNDLLMQWYIDAMIYRCNSIRTRELMFRFTPKARSQMYVKPRVNEGVRASMRTRIRVYGEGEFTPLISRPTWGGRVIVSWRLDCHRQRLYQGKTKDPIDECDRASPLHPRRHLTPDARFAPTFAFTPITAQKLSVHLHGTTRPQKYALSPASVCSIVICCLLKCNLSICRDKEKGIYIYI